MNLNQPIQGRLFERLSHIKTGATGSLTASLILMTLTAGARPEFGAQQTVTTQADNARSVVAADLDNDGDNDILYCSLDDDEVGWFENTDGQGTFGEVQYIDVLTNGPSSVAVGDLDKDGDLDIMATFSLSNTVRWYENRVVQGSRGIFFNKPTLTTQASGAQDVASVDLDGDGDVDIVQASSQDDTISWFSNNNNGTFAAEVTISTSIDGAYTVYPAKIDGDNDFDLLVIAHAGGDMIWLENAGPGNATSWTPHIVDNAIIEPVDGIAVDLDGDQDLDLLTLSGSLSQVLWYQNMGSATFAAEVEIGQVFQGSSLHVADLDGDGDPDILATSTADDAVSWFENLGAGAFGMRRYVNTPDLDGFIGAPNGNADSAQSVFAADLTGDGVREVISASSLDDKIAWYPNTPRILGDVNTDGVVNQTDAHDALQCYLGVCPPIATVDSGDVCPPGGDGVITPRDAQGIYNITQGQAPCAP